MLSSQHGTPGVVCHDRVQEHDTSRARNAEAKVWSAKETFCETGSQQLLSQLHRRSVAVADLCNAERLVLTV